MYFLRIELAVRWNHPYNIAIGVFIPGQQTVTDAPVCSMMDNPDTIIQLNQVIGDLARVVRASIVHDKDRKCGGEGFEDRYGLPHHPFQRGIFIVGENDDTPGV